MCPNTTTREDSQSWPYKRQLIHLAVQVTKIKMLEIKTVMKLVFCKSESDVPNDPCTNDCRG